jgi:hypothetical protein
MLCLNKNRMEIIQSPKRCVLNRNRAIDNICIVTYPGFAWPIRRVLDLMIEYIGPLYNWLQQFTNHYLTHCHLLPTGHSTGTVRTSNWTPFYFVVLLQFWSELLWLCPLMTPRHGPPRKTPSSVVKNACLLVRYPEMDVLLLLTVYASGMCLPSRCLAMGICFTVLKFSVFFSLRF